MVGVWEQVEEMQAGRSRPIQLEVLILHYAWANNAVMLMTPDVRTMPMVMVEMMMRLAVLHRLLMLLRLNRHEEAMTMKMKMRMTRRAIWMWMETMRMIQVGLARLFEWEVKKQMMSVHSDTEPAVPLTVAAVTVAAVV